MYIVYTVVHIDARKGSTYASCVTLVGTGRPAAGLERLTFGDSFESLERVKLPASLQQLTLGEGAGPMILGVRSLLNSSI